MQLVRCAQATVSSLRTPLVAQILCLNGNIVKLYCTTGLVFNPAINGMRNIGNDSKFVDVIYVKIFLDLVYSTGAITTLLS